MMDVLQGGWRVEQALRDSPVGPGLSAETSALKNKADRLQGELKRLSTATRAMWLLVKEKHGFSDDELLAKIDELNKAGAAADGWRAKEAAPTCPQCSRPLTHSQPKCLYCGQEIRWDPFDN
jgi:hypothetical protein